VKHEALSTVLIDKIFVLDWMLLPLLIIPTTGWTIQRQMNWTDPYHTTDTPPQTPAPVIIPFRQPKWMHMNHVTDTLLQILSPAILHLSIHKRFNEQHNFFGT